MQLLNLYSIMETQSFSVQLRGDSQLVWLLQVVQLLKLYVIMDSYTVVKQCNYPERAQSKSCTTHSSHTTGETVCHYGHLKFFSAIQLSQRGLVKTVSHATCKTVSHYGHRFFRTIIRKGPSQLVRLIQLLLDWWNLISLWTLKVF